MIASLSLVTSLGLVAGRASAAPAENNGAGGGGPKATTTTIASGGSTGGNGGGGVANPKLTAVTSLSPHRVLATYDRDLDAAALEVSSYAFYSTQAVNLPVTGVARATNNQAFVMTATQEPVTYEVKKPKTPRPVTFQGSQAVEPRLQSAQAVSSTQIALTFNMPMGAGADNPASYQINVAGSTQTLAVQSAVVSGTQVLLTTAPQQAVAYTLTVGDIQSLSGIYIAPTATSVGFTGSTVPAGPMLLSATPQGETGVLLTFDTALAASATETARYTSTPSFSVESAVLLSGNKQVVLATSPLYDVNYTVTANVVDVNGRAINPNFKSATFTGSRTVDNTRPKVTSAGSTGNTTVVVQFSKAMADNAIDPSRYAIVQLNVNPEVGALPVTAAAFADASRLSVKLTTRSQNEVTYQVTANNVTDQMGNPLADKVISNGVLLVDPTSFTFPGTPPTGAERVNSDCQTGDTSDDDPPKYCDSLYDNQEYLGWQITVTLANGETTQRQVTSNPDVDDTDDDGLTDDVEKSLGIDPRDNDTDDDGLSDYSEFNEFFSDPTNQDSDKDTLFDGLEAATFNTSPLFADTDGDQLRDDYEINVNRNPKVADLPQPILTLGDMRLGLDVRFTESNGLTSREVEAKRFESVLTQSQSQEFSRSESTSHEVATKVGFEAGYTLGWQVGLFKAESKHELSFGVSTETSNTNSWSSNFTANSAQASQSAYTDSLSTEQEVAKDSSVTRDVYGGRVQIGVFLEGRGNVAFTVRNLQVAALMQDPDNPSILTPIATLLPDSGPDTAFNLGPLVAAKGPIIFSNTDASPGLVEELMKNPRGLVFRFSNYDIVDEAGRNFAFTSQEVNDRTARIAIDYGGFDANGDGKGEETEILRVATGVIGRRVVDTNGDSVIDDKDRKVVFDLAGKQVGISLRDALEAAGLKWYDEDVTPTNSLTNLADRTNSFSTKKLPVDTGGTLEVIYRIRNRNVQLGSPSEWMVVTPTGIDPNPRLDSRVLLPGSNVTLGFVQDQDSDRLPALTESVYGCLDNNKDTDNDTLDDRFETLVGWDIETKLNSGRVHSSCRSTDTDGDGLTDVDEAPGVLKRDTAGLVLFDDGVDDGTGDLYIAANAPKRNTTAPQDPLLGWALSEQITDPSSRDTDLDGLEDRFELTPYQNGAALPMRQTSPEHPDSDFDSLTDGVERRLQSDPRVDDKAAFWDSDRDGLTDAQEVGDDNHNFVIDPAEIGAGAGWDVVITQVHARTEKWAEICFNGVCRPQLVSAPSRVYSSKFDADTDDDGLSDYEEYKLKTNPTKENGLDTDGDGLTDFQEVKGFTLRDGNTVKTSPVKVDTDNDKRSDGEEADLPDYEIIVVAVEGKDPYRAFSHPLKADTDLDSLVDGDEQLGNLLIGLRVPGSTDPSKPDTDGDGANDYRESLSEGERRPVVPDHHVEVFFEGISVTKSGDDDPGDINYLLQIKSGDYAGGGVSGTATVAAGNHIDLRHEAANMHSVSSAATLNEEIYVFGWIDELDDSTRDCSIQFPGFVTSPADGPGRMAGSSITLGQQPWNLHRKVTCASGQEFDITLHLTIQAS